MPPKAPPVPKRSVEDVVAEYTAKEAAHLQRMEALRLALTAASRDCDAARLDLVAVRDNRIYYDTRVAALTASNEAHDARCEADWESVKSATEQVKRQRRDKGYEINYVREVVRDVEREMEIVSSSITDIQADARCDTRSLEQVLDRLATVAVALETERPKLVRTMDALQQTRDRVDAAAPKRLTNPVVPRQQLTIIAGCAMGGDSKRASLDSSYAAVPLRSVLSATEVIRRLEHTLTSRYGFDVVERIVPQVFSSPQLTSSNLSEVERRLRLRVDRALDKAADASLVEGVSTSSLVILHCPSRYRTTSTAGTSSIQEIVLLASQLSDAAKEVLRASPGGRGVDLDAIGTVEIPLSTVVAKIISSSKNPNVTLLIDTWPAPPSGDASDDSVGFSLFWSRCMSTPLLYQYVTSHDPTLVARRHADVAALLPHTTMPRACMLESLFGLLEGTTSTHLVDPRTISESLEASIDRRFGSLMHRVKQFNGPFATLALEPQQLRVVHHAMPLHRRPLPSPQALHVETRTAHAALGEGSLPFEYKWSSRSTVRRVKQMDPDSTRLIRLHAESSSSAPHVRLLMDIAVEDPQYHIPDEEVENLERSKDVDDDGNFANRSRRRSKRLTDDLEVWGDLISRRLQQALITADEDCRLLRRVASIKQRATLLSNGLEDADAGPLGIAVSCNPLDNPTRALLRDVLSPTQWLMEGKRVEDRSVQVELLFTLDVSDVGSATMPQFADVTQAKDALAHSIKRRFELLCEQLDTARPTNLVLQVGYHVTVNRRGSATDSAHFQARVQLMAILTEKATVDLPKAIIEAKHYLRASLTSLTRRYETTGIASHQWIPCAEMTLAPGSDTASHHQFRVTHILHVLRSWEVGLRVVPSDVYITEMTMERHVLWLQHLLRCVLINGGMTGGVTPSSDAPLVRVLDVHEFPKFVGVQSRSTTTIDHIRLGDDVLGPGSAIQRLSECELSVGLTQLFAGSVSYMPGSVHRERELLSLLGRTREPQCAGVVLLTWLIPQSFASVAQYASPPRDVSPSSASTNGEIRYLVDSLVTQFHRQRRLASGESLNRQLFIVATSTLEYEEGSAYQLLTESSALVADRPSTAARHVKERGGSLPLEELGINRDEGTSNEPNASSIVSVVDDTDNPAEYDETFRRLPNACLFEHSVHEAAPLLSLYPLSRRYWSEVAQVTRSHGSSDLADKVKLIAVVWDAKGSQPHVQSFATIPSSPLHHEPTTHGVLQATEVDRFLQSVIVASQRSQPPPLPEPTMPLEVETKSSPCVLEVLHGTTIVSENHAVSNAVVPAPPSTVASKVRPAADAEQPPVDAEPIAPTDAPLSSIRPDEAAHGTDEVTTSSATDGTTVLVGEQGNTTTPDIPTDTVPSNDVPATVAHETAQHEAPIVLDDVTSGTTASTGADQESSQGEAAPPTIAPPQEEAPSTVAPE